MNTINSLLDRLATSHNLDDASLLHLLSNFDKQNLAYASTLAKECSRQTFGNTVYMRGLIEISSYCLQDCYYCGLRNSNKTALRYRLSSNQILECSQIGYSLGFRSFVFQGGEDPFFTDANLVSLISDFKRNFPDCALTLSLGERSDVSYRLLKNAGVDRYLLRHETATSKHYSQLHPPKQQLSTRLHALSTLRAEGYQIGAGFMVGSPFQTLGHLVSDLRFIKNIAPEMVGIGPFLPHHATPFAANPPGNLDLTLLVLALVRLLLPTVLLPATTALGTLHPDGRELGVLSGANVVMPNLSPSNTRKQYMIYDNKISTGAEAAESKHLLAQKVASIGYRLSGERGDAPSFIQASQI